MLRGHTLWELLDRRMDDTPDALMAVDEDMSTITFGEYWSECERTAAGLFDQGVRPGSVVSWLLPTWIESLVLAGALSRLGVTQNPIRPGHGEREIGFITHQSGASLLVVPSVWQGIDYEDVGRAVSAANGANMRVLVTDRALPQGDPSILPPVEGPADPFDRPVRWLFHTSGAAADPRGARHTDASIAAAAKAMVQRFGVVASDRNALLVPFSHIQGLVWLFASLRTGCANILVEHFDPDGTPEVLSREGVSLVGGRSDLMGALLEYQRKQLTPAFPNLRALMVMDPRCSPALVDEARRVLDVPLLSCYGSTDAPLIATGDPATGDDAAATGRVHPVDGVELRLVPADPSAPPGQIGEIRVRAPQVMIGHVDPTLDTDAFDEDGFLCTGDLGRLDGSGSLVVEGRADEVFVRSGERISARELEELLGAHPAIGEAVVVGLPDPDAGRRICAIVQTTRGVSPIDHEDLLDHLRGVGVAPQLLPEQLEHVEVIPRNPLGEVLRQVLIDQFKG